jgi:hypothetical protein
MPAIDVNTQAKGSKGLLPCVARLLLSARRPTVVVGDFTDLEDKTMSNEFGGWDPDDVDAFWDKVYEIEAAGCESDEQLDAALAKFGLEDKAQFDAVREAFGQRHGEDSSFMQAAVDSRTRSVKNAMTGRMQGELKGELAPFEGVTLEQWAFVMAKVAASQDITALLAKAGWDRPKWDRVSAEWNARMSRDTTATIASAYGQAFVASGDGPFAEAGKQTADSMLDASKRSVEGQEPISFDRWIEIGEAQSAGARQGLDAAAVLKSYKLTPAEWGTVGGWWSQKFNANAMKMIADYNRISEKYREKFATGFAADSIEF